MCLRNREGNIELWLPGRWRTGTDWFYGYYLQFNRRTDGSNWVKVTVTHVADNKIKDTIRYIREWIRSR